MASVCAAQRIPVVLFNRYVPTLKVTAICCDNVAGGRVVAEYLHDTAHVRPAYVGGEGDATTNLDRARGFTGRLQELGVALHAHEAGGAFSYGAGYSAADRLVRQNIRPDSIFFASDVMAVGGLDAIRAANLRVPDDISVIVFDEHPIAGYLAPALTTIKMPLREMGALATRMLIGSIMGETHAQTVMVEAASELVERASVAPCRGGR